MGFDFKFSFDNIDIPFNIKIFSITNLLSFSFKLLKMHKVSNKYILSEEKKFKPF